MPVLQVMTGKMPVLQVMTGKMPVLQVMTGKMPVLQVMTGKMPVLQVMTGKMPVLQAPGNRDESGDHYSRRGPRCSGRSAAAASLAHAASRPVEGCEAAGFAATDGRSLRAVD